MAVRGRALPMLTQGAPYGAGRGHGRSMPEDTLHVCTIKVERPTALHWTELLVIVQQG